MDQVKTEYITRHAIQESQYADSYHWNDRKLVERARYARLTEVIADTVERTAKRHGRTAVSICDFGCGDGKSTVALKQLLERTGLETEVVGVDVSPKAIEWARLKSAEVMANPPTFIVGTITDGLNALTPSKNHAALFVVMREVIEHLPEYVIDNVLNETAAFSSTTTVLVTTPSTNSPVEPKHLRHYTTATLQQTFERNSFSSPDIRGFGYRPRGLFRPLKRLKATLNGVPLLWRIMNPAWRIVSPNRAITLVAVGEPELRG